jgi:hypothetical protein
MAWAIGYLLGASYNVQIPQQRDLVDRVLEETHRQAYEPKNLIIFSQFMFRQI